MLKSNRKSYYSDASFDAKFDCLTQTDFENISRKVENQAAPPQSDIVTDL